MLRAPREETEKTKAPELDFHITMMLSLPDPIPAGELPDFSKATILGGVVFEYYTQANVGLLTYLLVDSKYRGLRSSSLPFLVLRAHHVTTMNHHADICWIDTICRIGIYFGREVP
jgi:hypothetical protein